MDTPTSPSQPVPMPSPVPPPATPPSSGTRWGLIIGALALVVLAGGVAAYVAGLLPFGPAPEATPEPSPSAVAPSGTPLPAGVKTFKSDALGISFEYLAAQGEPVIEKGDTVYVGGLQGQWVRMFTKDSGDDLKAAIQKRFLTGLSEQDCPVVITQNGTVSTGAINVGFEMTGWDDARWDASSCPADYRVTNGIRYFWMDADHPDRFFFFSIGQYAILAQPDAPGGGELTWQDTFRVVNRAIPTSSSTEGWKTYTNTQFGFLLKYPSTWTLRDQSTLSSTGLAIDIDPPDAASMFGYFTIGIDTRSLETIDSVLLGAGAKKSAITVDGISTHSYLMGSGQTYVVVPKGGTIFFFDLAPSVPEIPQMLGTFKFTQ